MASTDAILRRRLLSGAAAGIVAGGATYTGWPWSDDKAFHVPGRLLGANAALGHRLRDGDFPTPSVVRHEHVVIIGGGIAGLSAAWRLAKRGVPFTLLEPEHQVGGNATSGRNDVSAYPWGAHYVPRLTREAVHAAELFEDLGVITGRGDNGDPVYNEFYLCADPRERLFILGRWQEDLLPAIGVTHEDQIQYEAFFAAMQQFRSRRGTDGCKAFTFRWNSVPVTLTCERWIGLAWRRG